MWAGIAARALAKIIRKEKSMVEGKKLRELVVKGEDKSEKKQSQTMLAEQILQKI